MDKSQFFFMLFPIVRGDIKQESYLVSTNAASARVPLLPACHTRTLTHTRTRVCTHTHTHTQTLTHTHLRRKHKRADRCCFANVLVLIWPICFKSIQTRVTITDSLIWHQSPGQAWKGETETLLCFDVFFSLTLQIIYTLALICRLNMYSSYVNPLCNGLYLVFNPKQRYYPLFCALCVVCESCNQHESLIR